VDVEAIQQGLANAADTITGLRCFPALPGTINPPTFAPVEFELAYHGTFSATRGLTEITFTCGVYASDSDQGRKQLLPFLAETGAGSVPAALEADKTLGGAAKTLVVQRVRGAYRLYEVGGTDYLGAMIDVKVWA
jgi:hypothetical protein